MDGALKEIGHGQALALVRITRFMPGRPNLEEASELQIGVVHPEYGKEISPAWGEGQGLGAP
jgi:hypothetical protein